MTAVLWALFIAALLMIVHEVRCEQGKLLTFPLERRRGTGRGRSMQFRSVEFTRKESDGVYWTTIQIGTPPQQFSVIVDTGSSSIAVPCALCDCGNHNKFNPELSSTVEKTGFRYNQCYSEGSCNSGDILSDLACFGDACQANETVRHRFGCCNTYARAFKTQDADGIIGLSGSPDTLIADLRAHHDLLKDMFALCFGRSGGSLSVGGVWQRPMLEDPVWVPLVNSPMFYVVAITGLALNGIPFPASQGPSMPIIDSGSTFTYFPAAAHAATKAAFDVFCSQPGHCQGTKNPPGTPAEDVRDSIACYAPPSGITSYDHWFASNFPTISIQFGQSSVCIPPTTYFFLSKRDVKSFCVGILKDTKFILGAITMSDFTIIFDHENSRVGFARSNCDGNRNVTCCSKACSGTSYTNPPVALTKAPVALTKATVALTKAPVTLTNTPVAMFASVETITPSAADKEIPTESPAPLETDEPTSPLIADFWQGNVQVVSGLFFFLGIFFALFCAFGVWLCTPSQNRRASVTAAEPMPRRSEFQKINNTDDDTESQKIGNTDDDTESLAH